MIGHVVAPPATIGMLGGGQLGRYALDRGADDGVPHRGARTRRACSSRRGRRRAPRRRHTTTRPPSIGWPRRAPWSRPSSRTRRRRRSSGWRVRRSSRRRRRRWRSPRTGGPRSGSSPTTGLPVAPWGVVESADDRPDVGFPAILKTAQLGYDGKGQTAIASIDRIGDAWTAARRGARACSSGRWSSRPRSASSSPAPPTDGRRPTRCPRTPRRRRPRPHRRAGRASPVRLPNGRPSWRWRSPMLSTTSACSPSRCSSSTASCTSTSWRRARTTAGTGHSTRRAPASSNSRSGRCAGWVSGRRR